MTSLIKTLSIDIESFASIDLTKCGVYKYAENKDFEILLFGYSVNGEEVKVIDIAGGEKIPASIYNAILDDNVIKYAFNAMFERVCLSRFLGLPKGTYLNPKSWRCTMIWSAYMGLPFSLKGVGAILKLEDQKLDEGKDLIKYFCMPCSPTKANGKRIRNYYYHDKEKWELFKTYNKRDVEVELEIKERLKKFPVPESVWNEYHIDQEINDRGIMIDNTLVKNAIEITNKNNIELSSVMQNLTNLDNPNSVSQLKSWLESNGISVSSLGKKNVDNLINSIDDEKIKEVLKYRSMLSRTSISKYLAMNTSMCSDFRCRGMFQFYGANRTGRFSGRIVQLQNLPQNHIKTLDEARNLVKENNYEALDILYENIPDTLSQLIRTAFIPKEGCKFIVCDYSAIEARVLAWISKEKWVLEAFKNNEDIYCVTASKMFHVPVEKHGLNSHLRQKGKQAVLSCGYGGSVGALIAMGALDAGMKEEELKPLVEAWRASNSHIVEFWWEIDNLIKKVIKTKNRGFCGLIEAYYKSGMLFIKLPSGRVLSYCKPKITINELGKEAITYEGIGDAKKWERIESYGPKFVENIVQGISRDILCNAMKNLRNYRIVAHIHDELIIEAPINVSLSVIKEGMEKLPSWAEGLILRADGYECNYYKKD